MVTVEITMINKCIAMNERESGRRWRLRAWEGYTTINLSFEKFNIPISSDG